MTERWNPAFPYFPTHLSMRYNLDVVEETYNQDPTLSIHRSAVG